MNFKQTALPMKNKILKLLSEGDIQNAQYFVNFYNKLMPTDLELDILIIKSYICSNKFQDVKDIFNEKLGLGFSNTQMLYYNYTLYDQLKKYAALIEYNKDYTELEEYLKKCLYFWTNELKEELKFDSFESQISKIKSMNVGGYPRDINIELTTVCNSKCRFCTHEELIKSGQRKVKNMDFGFARYILDKISLITRIEGVADHKISFNPTGLGEPLLSPIYFDVISYVRKLFPKALIKSNSNGIALTEDIATKLIEKGPDSIILSMCFGNPQTYKEYLGVDKYYVVMNNIKKFLKMKGNRSPSSAIHIFNHEINNNDVINFINQWDGFLNENDNLIKYNYMELTNSSALRKDSVKHPCLQPWSTIMVDVDGYVFPCCLGVWSKREDDLLIGHISDEPYQLLSKIYEFRKRHLHKNFGICNKCAYLIEGAEDNKRFHEKLREKYGNDPEALARCSGRLDI